MGVGPIRMDPLPREKPLDVKSPASEPLSEASTMAGHGGTIFPDGKPSFANTQDEKPAVEATQFSFFTTRLDSVIHASSLSSLRSFYNPFDTLLETGSHSGLWWLDVTAPSDEDIETLSRFFDIHPLTTEDIKIRESREKIELFGPYYFLSLRPPQQIQMQDGVGTSSLNFYAIVFREGVLSFNLGNCPHPGNVRNRIKEHRSHLALTSDWICYALIDDIVDGFAPYISRVETGVEMMEEGVSITRPDDIGLALQRIYHCRKEVMHIRQLLNDKTDVVRCFARHCDAFGSSTAEVALYLSDIQDHVLTMMGNLSHSEQMLSRSQSKYLGRLSFDSTRMRNQMTATLSRLAVIGGIFVPMQYTTNLFAMNVQVPGEDTNLGWWFGILGVILGLICSALVILKRFRII